jgi:hypothetical protein
MLMVQKRLKGRGYVFKRPGNRLEIAVFSLSGIVLSQKTRIGGKTYLDKNPLLSVARGIGYFLGNPGLLARMTAFD